MGQVDEDSNMAPAGQLCGDKRGGEASAEEQ